MLNYTLISEELRHQLGEKRYASNVVYIAELLAELDPKTVPELNEAGADEWVVRRVINQLSGGRGVNKTSDALTQDRVSQLNEVVVADKRRTAGGITEYTSFNVRNSKYNARDKLKRITEIRTLLKENPTLCLSQIPSGSGNQTANDWLADQVGPHSQDNDSKFFRDMVESVRELSRLNVARNKKMTKVRDVINENDLDTLSPKQIWDKYGFAELLHQKYDARFRVRIQRLRKELQS